MDEIEYSDSVVNVLSFKSKNLSQMSISAFHGGLEWRDSATGGQQASDQVSIGQAAQTIQTAVASTATSAFEERDINEFFNPRECNLSLDSRYNLCHSVGEEILTEPDLRELL